MTAAQHQKAARIRRDLASGRAAAWKELWLAWYDGGGKGPEPTRDGAAVRPAGRLSSAVRPTGQGAAATLQETSPPPGGDTPDMFADVPLVELPPPPADLPAGAVPPPRQAGPVSLAPPAQAPTVDPAAEDAARRQSAAELAGAVAWLFEEGFEAALEIGVVPVPPNIAEKLPVIKGGLCKAVYGAADRVAYKYGLGLGEGLPYRDELVVAGAVGVSGLALYRRYFGPPPKNPARMPMVMDADAVERQERQDAAEAAHDDGPEDDFDPAGAAAEGGGWQGPSDDADPSSRTFKSEDGEVFNADDFTAIAGGKS